MKDAVPNQDYVPNWDMDSSDSYIRECRKIYQIKCSADYCFTGRPDFVLINKLYKEGRDRQVLSCDYVQFVDCLTGNLYRKRYTYYGYLKTPFRHKHEEHIDWKEKGKKTLSDKDKANAEWREHKGINIDKSKHGWRGRGCPKWLKRHSNKLHRQWQRGKINQGEWDDMSDVDYKLFQDPWMWD